MELVTRIFLVYFGDDESDLVAFYSILLVLFLTLGVTFELAIVAPESCDPTSSWLFFSPALKSSEKIGRSSRSAKGQEANWS